MVSLTSVFQNRCKQPIQMSKFVLMPVKAKASGSKKQCNSCGHVGGMAMKKCPSCGGGLFSKIWNGVKKVASVAGPILRAIPHPYAQTAGNIIKATTGHGRKKKSRRHSGGGSGLVSAPKNSQTVANYESATFGGPSGGARHKRVHK